MPILLLRLCAQLVVVGQTRPIESFHYLLALNDVPVGVSQTDPEIRRRVELAQKCLFNIRGYRQEWMPPKPFAGELPKESPLLEIGQMRIWNIGPENTPEEKAANAS